MQWRRIPATGVTVVTATLLAGCLAGALVGCRAQPAPGSDEDPERVYRGYVALGDSFTTAQGVPTTEETSGCGRSTGSYPHLLAAALGATLTDVSCGGAMTLQGTAPQEVPGGSVPPQLDALGASTDLVTVGLGTNDDHLYVTLFATCVAVRPEDPEGSPCREAMTTPDGEDVLAGIVGDVERRLVDLLGEVRRRSPEADVVLVGYPQMVPPEGGCEILPLATGDLDYVRQTWQSLADAMEQAADEAGVLYADMMARSEGHDICAGDDAWVAGAVADERATAFHPYGEEQQAAAELVLEVLGR